MLLCSKCYIRWTTKQIFLCHDIGRRPPLVVTHRDKMTADEISETTDTIQVTLGIARGRIFYVRNIVDESDSIDTETRQSLLNMLLCCIKDGQSGSRFHDLQDQQGIKEEEVVKQQLNKTEEADDERINREIRKKKLDIEKAYVDHDKAKVDKGLEETLAATTKIRLGTEELREKRENERKIEMEKTSLEMAKIDTEKAALDEERERDKEITKQQKKLIADLNKMKIEVIRKDMEAHFKKAGPFSN